MITIKQMNVYIFLSSYWDYYHPSFKGGGDITISAYELIEKKENIYVSIW